MFSRDDVIIIGAGPIGLAQAIAIKKLNPELKVVIFERHPVYERHHNLVLKSKNLRKFMEATNTTKDPELHRLLSRIQQRKGSIRTSELEDVLRDKAEKLGVTIITQKIDETNFQAQVLSRKPRLIIGADGTHSITSDYIFGKDNQIKHEFDYVLQLRYTIDDPQTSIALPVPSFIQDLITYGMAGEERVGTDAVTTQIMITKEEFESLNKYSSKEPLHLYPGGCDLVFMSSTLDESTFRNLPRFESNAAYVRSENGFFYINKAKKIREKLDCDLAFLNDFQMEMTLKNSESILDSKEEKLDTASTAMTLKSEQLTKIAENTGHTHPEDVFDETGQFPNHVLPKNVRDFLNNYIQKKIGQGVKIKSNSIRISVNEAPATHATNIYKLHETEDKEMTPVVLAGDAALGLSYFKGLNAGLLLTVTFLTYLAGALRGNLQDQDLMHRQLQEYERWFQTEWAPQNVLDVEKFSTWQIRRPWMLTQYLQAVKGSSFAFEDRLTDDELNLTAFDYMKEAKKVKQNGAADDIAEEKKLGEYPPGYPYPHRSYSLVQSWQIENVSVRHSLKKTAKLLTDIFSPYKWKGQYKQDLRQPLRGIANLITGAIMIIAGLNRQPMRSMQGLFVLLRGALEIITFPIAWFVKPITRGIITSIVGMPKIENNRGFQKLVEKGNQYVNEHTGADAKETTDADMYAARALCMDIHRKFKKGLRRGQQSDILEKAEIETYRASVIPKAIVEEDSTEQESGAHFNLKTNKYLMLFAPTRPDSVVQPDLVVDATRNVPN